MKTQLLCTFTTKRDIHSTIEKIKESYTVTFNKIYVLQNEDNVKELICTYNVESNDNVDYNVVSNTISLHRKKYSNTLYTINALNALIQILNNGVLDTTYQLDWENYRNTMLLTNEEGLKRVQTEVEDIIYIKIKR